MQIADILAGIMLTALMLYAILAGADFGGGVWDLLASGPRAEDQRKLVVKAIGPIWEANHVWLILVIVLMFVCFPPAFAAISIALHIPLTLMLIGIVLRGSAFAFRVYDERGHVKQRHWALLFAISSVYTPIMLGVSLGAATSGDIIFRDGVLVTGFFKSWLHLFPWSVGLFTLSLFSFLAAVFLTCEADSNELKEDFRTRALSSGIVVAVTALLVLIFARSGAPQLWQALMEQWWAWPVHIVTGLFALTALYFLYKRQYIVARLFAVAQVAAIVLAWGVAEQPYLVRPDITIQSAASPNSVLVPVLIALVSGMFILFPSLFYLYRVFKGREAFELIRDRK